MGRSTRRLARRGEAGAKGEWIYASIGQTFVNDPRPTRDPIDKIAPDNPVLLRSWFGHGHLFNSAAMRRIKMREEEPVPDHRPLPAALSCGSSLWRRRLHRLSELSFQR